MSHDGTGKLTFMEYQTLQRGIFQTMLSAEFVICSESFKRRLVNMECSVLILGQRGFGTQNQILAISLTCRKYKDQ